MTNKPTGTKIKINNHEIIVFDDDEIIVYHKFADLIRKNKVTTLWEDT